MVIEKGSVGVSDQVPYPTVGSDEIVVKVKSVALNPTDWKVGVPLTPIGLMF